MNPKIACIILTQGSRPNELKKAINSVRGQISVEIDLVVVGNGFDPKSQTDEKSLALPQNLGIPAGRNAGVEHVAGDFLFFLDDDVYLPDEDFLARAIGYFEANPKIGLIQPKPEDPQRLEIPRRWVPRIYLGNPDRPSKAFSLWEGATLVSREVFEKAGKWPADFFYGHEGVALVWKVWNLGKLCQYQPELQVAHPLAEPSERHRDFYFYNARNRYWLANRYLPFGFKQIYLLNWYVLSKFRLRKNAAAWEIWKFGWSEGKLDSKKETISYLALLRMLRWGRLLIV